MRKRRDNQQVAPVKNNQTNGIRRTRLYHAKARSRITNHGHLLPDIDGRTMWARRLRDLTAMLVADQGGDDVISAARMAIVRRAAIIQIELELRELRFADEEPSYLQLEQYSRISGNLRRMLESLGLERRAKDVTPPSVDAYLEHVKQQQVAAEELAEADE
jgi:hypothetical protein